jgi:hypothetical protein
MKLLAVICLLHTVHSADRRPSIVLHWNPFCLVQYVYLISLYNFVNSYIIYIIGSGLPFGHVLSAIIFSHACVSFGYTLKRLAVRDFVYWWTKEVTCMLTFSQIIFFPNSLRMILTAINQYWYYSSIYKIKTILLTIKVPLCCN